MRGRFKKRTIRSPAKHGLPPPVSSRLRPQWSREFESQWQQLYDLCQDRGSRIRLMGLREQFERRKSGVSESAAAEIELATMLVHAGFSISFLQESKARTADLECYLGVNRLFFEITVIVPTTSHKDFVWLKSVQEGEGNESPEGHQQRVLLHRLVARMAEKAKQLDRYCAPVVLAVTVPDQVHRMNRKRPEERLDLQRLAGGLASVLPQVPQLSAVLLTIWRAQPQESRANIRLSNIHYVTRSSSSTGVPRIRLLAINSFAKYELCREEIQMLQKAM